MPSVSIREDAAAAGPLAAITAAPVRHSSPYVALDREDWSRLARSTRVPLTAAEIERIQGLGDRVDEDEVREVYLPLSRLLNLYVNASQRLHAATSTFLEEHNGKTPFIIGVAGSVAVGKSTTARILRELLCRWPGTPRVDLVTTDGFLYPNDELERRNLLRRKGFPESYDRRELLRFVVDVKSGRQQAIAPVYSHLTYDIVPGEEVVIRRPDVLIVEGLNVLQPARQRSDGLAGLSISDFFDFSVYVDADSSDVRDWYIHRFLKLRQTAFTDPRSYFHRYSRLSDEDAVELAGQIWSDINEPNLIDNILPTRGRAQLVLRKGRHQSRNI
ncbi:MAG: type I pantothenate kinase [Micrococcales bacterium]|nr:MAG: type I pantothenate kinase [Micrococcales bacterium]